MVKNPTIYNNETLLCVPPLPRVIILQITTKVNLSHFSIKTTETPFDSGTMSL